MFDRRPSFRHGVHPPTAKDETRDRAIRQFPFAPLLVLPLSTLIDRPSRPLVVEGQEVQRGETIAAPDGPLTVAMHAPASGFVRRIAPAPTILGKMQPSIFIEPFPGSTQAIAGGDACPLSADRQEIIRAIRDAGAVGLGGAAFPTYAKLQAALDHPVDVILINGAECEPYLTADHRVMLEQADDVVRGIRYLLRASGAGRAVVAIESDKSDAAESIRAAAGGDGTIVVELLKVKYPQGAEKVLIAAVLGRQVPSRGLPIDVGTLCFNVASAAEIGNCLGGGTGLVDRVITVGGPPVREPGNYRVPLGTPLRFLLETVGMSDEAAIVFLGGPMMGQAVSSLEIPVGKGTTGVIALSPTQTASIDRQPTHPCIRCGYCVEACPMFLNPSQLGLLAQGGHYQTMADRHHLMDCFECGCCSYVCPSHIPLVQQFRVAKAALKKSAAKDRPVRGAGGGGC